MKRLGVDNEIRSHKEQHQTDAFTGYIKYISAICRHSDKKFTLEMLLPRRYKC